MLAIEPHWPSHPAPRPGPTVPDTAFSLGKRHIWDFLAEVAALVSRQPWCWFCCLVPNSLCPPFSLHLMNPEFPGFCLTPGSKFYYVCQIQGTPKSSQPPCLALSFPPKLPLALLVLSLNLWPIASQSFITLVEYPLSPQWRPCICPIVTFLKKPSAKRSSTMTLLIISRLGLI